MTVDVFPRPQPNGEAMQTQLEPVKQTDNSPSVARGCAITAEARWSETPEKPFYPEANSYSVKTPIHRSFSAFAVPNSLISWALKIFPTTGFQLARKFGLQTPAPRTLLILERFSYVRPATMKRSRSYQTAGCALSGNSRKFGAM